MNETSLADYCKPTPAMEYLQGIARDTFSVEPNPMERWIRIVFSKYPGKLTVAMARLENIADTLFSEMDKTFNGNSDPGVPAFYWVRQAHCFLSRYQDALHISREEVNRKRKDVIQMLTSSMIDGYEKRILDFKSKLIEYSRKGEDLWERLTEEGLEEGDFVKAFLCNRNRELYRAEREEIEKDELNHPYLFFDVEEDSEGVDASLIAFAKTWKRYFHPLGDGYLVPHQRLLPKNSD